MAKVIVFGDIDSLTPLYVSVNGSKEMSITNGKPTEIPVSAGVVSVFATTVSKFQRATMSLQGGGAMGNISNALTASTNDYIEGEVELNEDECLLIKVELKGLKSNIYNKVVNYAEVNEYLDESEIYQYGEAVKGGKSKWVALVLCMFFGMFGVHRFYEKRIATGIICLLSFILTFGVTFVTNSYILAVIPGAVLVYFWLIDFWRILFRRK